MTFSPSSLGYPSKKEKGIYMAIARRSPLLGSSARGNLQQPLLSCFSPCPKNRKKMKSFHQIIPRRFDALSRTIARLLYAGRVAESEMRIENEKGPQRSRERERKRAEATSGEKARAMINDQELLGRLQK